MNYLNEAYLKKLRSTASRSNMDFKLGAIVIDSLGNSYTGYNYNTSRGSSSLHAEMAALEKCLRQYRLLKYVKLLLKHKGLRRKLKQIKPNLTSLRCTIIVIRFDKHGSIKCSRPCSDCQHIFNVCKLLGIKFKIIHADETHKLVNYTGSTKFSNNGIYC